MNKPRIVGLCYENDFPGKVLRLHQDEPEHFVLEFGDASIDLNGEQLLQLGPAIAGLVEFARKRHTMAKNLLENG